MQDDIELFAEQVRDGPKPIDPWLIPPGTLCYVNAAAGEVWMAQGVPARRWLYDMELDAWAATCP
jgi:hypothetical protein